MSGADVANLLTWMVIGLVGITVVAALVWACVEFWAYIL